MTSNSSSSSSNIAGAKAAMEKFKYEVANEIGVPLKQGYNGDLTSAQNGYVGGNMTKKMVAFAEQAIASGQANSINNAAQTQQMK